MDFKIGDIVRVKPNVDWHPDYLNKRFIIKEKDSLISYQHVFRLRPCEWESNTFLHKKGLILVKEEDLLDLIPDDKLEPIKNLKKHTI